MPFEELAEILFARLAAPTSIEALYGEMSGAAPGDDPGQVLEHLLFSDARIGWMAAGEEIFYRYDRLFDGFTFTHRVTAAEIEAGSLSADPGFSSAADLLIESRRQGVEVAGPALRLANQSEPAPTEADPDATRNVYTYQGSDGWLDGCEPGRLCGLEITGGDRFGEGEAFSVAFVPVVDEPDEAAAEALAARLADSIPSVRPPDWGAADLSRLLVYVLLTPEPGAGQEEGHASLGLDVIPPLLEAAEQARLSVQGHMAGPPGFDWEAAQEEAPLRSVVSRFRLEAPAVKRLQAAVSAFKRWEDEGDGSLPSGELFDSTVAAEAFGALLLATTNGTDEEADRHRAIGAFAEALGDRTRRTVALIWLQSVAAGADADAARQCELLEEASRLDPDDGAVGEDLGYCRVDQSRYLDAFELLERAGARGPTMAFVSDLTKFARLDVGRNEPCPCHSGRKFKQCHGSGRAEVSQADATAALYRKPGRLLRSGLGMPYWELWPGKWGANHVAGEEEPEFASTDWRAGLDTLDDLGVLSDILLSEGGGMARFVEFRQALLPPDEVAVSQRWAEVERGLFRVAEVDPESGVLQLDPVSNSGSAPGERVDLQR